MTHTIEALVHQYLSQERGFLNGGGCETRHEWASIDVNEAIARTGVAPEHAIGEQPLALYTMEEEYPEMFNGFLLFTDRRMVGRFPRLNGTFGDVHFRYGWLQGATLESGMLTQKLKVQHANTVTEVSFGAYDEKLKAFIDAVVALPPDRREPAQNPLCSPSDVDPTGARTAQPYVADDPRTSLLLEYVARAHESGLMTPQIGADLVSRVVLQQRNERYGRGVHDSSWMSPLGRDDLSNVFVAVYQNPLQHVEQPHRALTFDSRNKTDKFLDGLDTVSAIASLDAGAMIGSAFGPKDVRQFTATMLDTGSFCSFRLFAGQSPLSQAAPELTEEIHYLLDRLEAALVVRRCAYGWTESAHALLSTPSSEILQRFEAVVGSFDPTVLGRPRDQERRGR